MRTSATTMCMAVSIACLAYAQALQPATQQHIAAGPPALLAPATRVATARQATADFEDMTDEQRLAEQRRQIQIAQEKEERKKKEEGLEMWREKTGKKLHAEEDRERKEKQVMTDQTRDRYRKMKDQRDTAAGDLGVLDELVSDEEAEAMDKTYNLRDTEQRRTQLDAMIRELDEEMLQQKAIQGALQQQVAQAQAETMAADQLLDLEEEAKEAVMDEKMKVKKVLQEKKEKHEGLDMWRTKTGKEAQDVRNRERKEQDKTITKKRNEARSFKASQRIKLSKSEEEALQQLEEKYSQTEAAQEMQRLLERMQQIEQLVDEERQRKEKEMEVILQGARGRSEGLTEEELLELEDIELKKAALEKAKVKYAIDQQKAKKDSVDRYREEAGKASEEALRDRKERQKRLTKALNKMRGGKYTEKAMEVDQSVEDPYVQYLEQEELELARLYTESQAALQWAALRERVERVKQQVADDRERAIVGDALAQEEEELMEFEAKQLQLMDKEEMKVKREQDEKRQRLQGIDASREKDGKLGREGEMERKEQQRKVALQRQQGRVTKYDSLTGDEELTDGELDELEMMLMDQYYTQTTEGAVIAEMTQKVKAIEDQLEKSRRSQQKTDNDDEDDNGPAAPGASGSSGTSVGASQVSSATFNFQALLAPIGLVATFFATVLGITSKFGRRSASQGITDADPQNYYTA